MEAMSLCQKTNRQTDFHSQNAVASQKTFTTRLGLKLAQKTPWFMITHNILVPMVSRPELSHINRDYSVVVHTQHFAPLQTKNAKYSKCTNKQFTNKVQLESFANKQQMSVSAG